MPAVAIAVPATQCGGGDRLVQFGEEDGQHQRGADDDRGAGRR
jgi:hypothetical protein